MLDGQFPVVIFPEALAGNGYLNSMYPYLFLYIPAFLRLFGVSLALSYKTLIFLANIATVAITWIINPMTSVPVCLPSGNGAVYSAALPFHQYLCEGRFGRNAGDDLSAGGDRRLLSGACGG